MPSYSFGQAGYPSGKGEKRISAEDLLSVVTAVFAAAGMNLTDSALLAETLVFADLRGVHSHGVLRVPDYVAKLTTGGVDPEGSPRIIRRRASTVLIDGGNSMGQIGGMFAIRTAIGLARDTGAGIATVRGSNHCGAMAFFAMEAAKEGMVGMAATNALPTMAPWGGVEKIVGINPLAIAAPAAEEPTLVIDTSFSNSSHGKIRVYHQKGFPIPSHWACDAQGRPTTDAAAALEGFLQPIGAYKGVGLAIMMGVLSSMLAGAAYGEELGDMVSGAKAGRDGHFFLAIDIASFGDLEIFRARVDELIHRIRTSERAEGVARIYAPGELEAETEQLYRAEGIPLPAETLEGLLDAAAAVNAVLPESALSLLR